MNKTIYDAVKKIRQENIVSFHMPGHKYGRLPRKIEYQEFFSDIYEFDTTEIYGTDNLHNPKGIIKQSQINSRKILFPESDNYDLIYLVNGSTCGIESSIFCSVKKGDKIILNRGCHQSVYNSCLVSDLKPIFVRENISKEGVFIGVEEREYIEAIENNKDASVVIITRPTYYGMVFDVENIIAKAHEYGMRVIVDEAHGAHFNLHDIFPKSSVYFGADFVIQSLHKTLPCFTQASVLLVNRDRINRNEMGKLSSSLNIFESSSPSYLLMSSIEICVEQTEKFGKKLMEDLLNNIYIFKRKVKNYKIFDTSDPTKIFINTIDKGINGHDFAKLLRYKYNIQVEMSNYSGILMLCSICNVKTDFDLMYDAMNDIVEKNMFTLNSDDNYEYDGFFGYDEKVNYDSLEDKSGSDDDIKSLKKSKKIDLDFPSAIPNRRLSPRDAFDATKVSIDIEKSVGKVCGEFIIPYPPGVCIIAPGEIVSEEIVDFIVKAREINMEINGMLSGDFSKIQIVDCD